MKILIIGGTGLIGCNITKKLRNKGHEVITNSPFTRINVLTGQGLAAALKNTQVVIDLSNAPTLEVEPAISYFKQAGKNLAAAEKAAGVKHHLTLSVIGADHMQNIGCLRAKKTQEDIVAASGLPFTIIRCTQFHEFIPTIVAIGTKDKEVHLSPVDFQPVAAEDVGDLITKIALQPPVNDFIEIAGPERAPMTEFAADYLKGTSQHKVIVSHEQPEYLGSPIPLSALVPSGKYVSGKISFGEWLTN